MAFTQATFATVGAYSTDTPRVYAYKSPDSSATVTATDYFLPKKSVLNAGDIIMCSLSDGFFQIEVGSDESSAGTPNSLKNPANWTIINSVDDFPVQDATTITLESGKTYIPGAAISTSKRFVVETFVNIFGDTAINVLWEYTGTGDMFTGVDVGIFFMQNISFRCELANQVFNFSDVASPQTSVVSFDRTPGVAKNATSIVSKKFGTFTDISILTLQTVGLTGLGYDDGLTLGGTGIDIIIVETFLTDSPNAAYVGFDFGNAIVSTSCKFDSYFSKANGAGGTAIKGLADSGNFADGVVATFLDNVFTGPVTPLSGISPSDIRTKFTNCPPIRDSTTRGTLHFEANALVTTISAEDTPVRINTLWSDGFDEERMTFRDKVTFDNTTNTLTTVDGFVDATGGTAFNHGLSNGDEIFLVENGGLPTGLAEDTKYFAGTIAATTFQLFSDSGLTTLVTFTTDGTEPNYYNHAQGDSASGWFIYIGVEDISIDISGWISIEKVSGATAPVRSVLMTTDGAFTVTEELNGSVVSAKNGEPGPTTMTAVIDVNTGDGFLIYVENPTGGGTVNNEALDARIVVSIA